MKKATRRIALTSLFLLLAPLGLAQTPKAPATPPAPKPEAGAPVPRPEAPKLLKPQDLKWNESLMWVQVIIDEGGVQPVRDYFGALSKGDFDALAGGTAKGMIKLQQTFYLNDATRAFTRLDTVLPGASVSLYQKNAFFRQDSIVRIVLLNRQFVENLAVSGFVKVEGEP